MPLVILAGPLHSFAQANDDQFETEIRPLLVEHCLDCHGPDLQESQLRVDHISFLQRGGERGPAIDKSNPSASRLLQVISYDDVDLQMPPDGKLPQQALQRLKDWIQRGAPWPDEPPPETAAEVAAFDLQARKEAHWCWQPIQRPELPGTPAGAKPIDQFLLQKLTSKGLTPLPLADKRTLIRRLSFDLIGLPPSRQEIDDFLADSSKDAYAKLVDRLLASPHFGERWARHWMDLVRYAETYGHEFDYPIPHAHEYRDYLIRALNADVPYDQFVREHVAGDLLSPPRLHPSDATNESMIATGFWFFHEQTHAPVDIRQHEADRLDNQIDTMGKTFLGVTLGCARCHDHKFDAISAKDVYALWGYLKSSRPQWIDLDPGGQWAEAARQIDDIRRQGDERLATDMSSNRSQLGQEIARYLLAADESLNGTAEETQEPSELVFADFESLTYDGWTVEGTAFGDTPQTPATLAPYQGDVKSKGNGLVNSHNIRPGGDVRAGDQHTGTLTSAPFTISLPYIRLLVGGGNHPGRTCIQLLVGDEVFREATGRNSNEMYQVEWDVSEKIGTDARLRIVDLETGHWGNIGVDEIIFSHRSTNGASVRRPAAMVAKERGLDSKRLKRWTQALAAPEVAQPDHPIYAVATLFRNARSNADFAKAKDEALSSSHGASKASNDEGDELFEAFTSGTWEGWYASGLAFGDGPTQPGTWDSTQPRGVIAQSGVAHSGQRGPAFTGALRSRTFTITKPFVHYRLAGSKGKIRLVVGNYMMDIYNKLLFGDLTFEVNQESMGWRAQSGDLTRYLGQQAYIEIIDEGDGWIAVDEIRFSNSPKPRLEPNARIGEMLSSNSIATKEALADAFGAQLALAIEQPTHATSRWAHWGTQKDLLGINHAPFADLNRQMVSLAARQPKPKRVLALADGDGIDLPIYIRGKHQSPGETAPRQFLEAVSGSDQPAAPQEGSGRLALAEQLLAADNPLTARVYVNRVWHHLFGRGIVATVDNFGVQGKPPTHPELLDWLADWFRQEGNWSTKELIRQIVLSDAYQRASFPVDTKLVTEDPENLLFGRAEPRRLQGEVIRDAILAISGRLDRTTYGPPVPVHITPFMEGRGKPESGPLDGNGRRSVYLSVKRNFLPPMMLAFDTPIPFQTVGQRTVSNVPAQSLILMNDPFVVAEAVRWAQQIVKLPVERRLEEMYVAAYARLPTEEEARAANEFVSLQTDVHQSLASAEQRELAVWSDLAHALWNVKEFIYLP